jgi:PhzF family phenazine biosynthesis protein
MIRVRTVDAFTDQVFGGNPAGVIRLDEPPAPSGGHSDAWCARVAAELNLSETAFILATDTEDADFGLRWFTPAVEVDLCGHATLASAHVLFADGLASPIRFSTRSGILTVSRQSDGSIAMDFPAQPPTKVDTPPELAAALGTAIGWCGIGGGDYLVELTDEAAVRAVQPDLAALARLPVRGVIVTALSDVPGSDDSVARRRQTAGGADFVSRFFGPAVGVPEDPVTGSAHTVLGPYWSAKLGRTELTGLQVSARTGLVGVKVEGDRVELTGRAVTVIDGMLQA